MKNRICSALQYIMATLAIVLFGPFLSSVPAGEMTESEKMAVRAEQLVAAMQKEGWAYAVNPLRGRRQSNCVFFLEELLRGAVPLSGAARERLMVNEPLRKGESLAALVESDDPRIRGVQSALAGIDTTGLAVPRLGAGRGDLIQYWYYSEKDGRLGGHSGVIIEVLENTPELFRFRLASVHQSLSGPGILELTLTGRNINHVYPVRVKASAPPVEVK